MKTDLHPTNYRLIVFQDLNNDATFLVRSTAESEETIKWEDGNEYPLVKVHISSASHPFYTGTEKLVDVEGRVDRFKARQDAAAAKKSALASKAKKAQKKSETDEDEVFQKVGGGSKQNQKPTKKKVQPKVEKKTEKPAKPVAEVVAENKPSTGDSTSEKTTEEQTDDK